MKNFTQEYSPQKGDQYYFSDQLLSISKTLRLTPPVFRGKEIMSEDYPEGRWKIEAEVLPRLDPPGSQLIRFRSRYPNWKNGVEMAMLETLSRIIEQFYDEIKPNSVFRHFARRDSIGQPVQPSLRGMNEKHHGDLGAHCHNLDILLGQEIFYMADLRRVHRHVKESLEEEKDILRVEVQVLTKENKELENKIYLQDDRIAQKDAHILALQAQCAHLCEQLSQMELQAEKNHPPDAPEPLVLTYPDEDTPKEATGVKKRKCGNTRKYIRSFKI